MKRQHPIHNASPLNKSVLVLANELISVSLHSPIQNFSNEFVWTSQETDRPKLLDFIRARRFGQKGDHPIVQTLDIQSSIMKARKQPHNVLFNNIPAHLIEFNRNVVRTRGSIICHREQRLLDLFLRELTAQIRHIYTLVLTPLLVYIYMNKELKKQS